MANTLPYIYLVYTFISLYVLSLFLLIYLRNRKTLFDAPKMTKAYSASFIVPAWNEEKTIADTIHALFAMEYPNLLEVIVVNDCSTDNTKAVVEGLKKQYPKLKLINNKVNSGNAAGAQNIGLKHAKGELIGVVDADSYPSKTVLKKLVGFFDDEKVGAVTTASRPKNDGKFIEKLQAMEYDQIAFIRRLMGYIDAIYVTPGALAVYRAEALRDIGGFDTKNLTQDIEATWHLTLKGWERRALLGDYVYTTVPNTIKSWFKQRRRWSVGGTQCILKYKRFFLREGMLGRFILPFFVVNTFLGLIGLGIFLYLLIGRAFSTFLFTTYSISVGSPVLTSSSSLFTLGFFNYLGIVLFIISTLVTVIILWLMESKFLRKKNAPMFLFFFLLYLPVFPFITLSAVISLLFGKYKWR